MEKLATGMYKEGKSDRTVVEMVEKIFPYQLHHQKKMSELYARLDPSLRRAELTLHAKQRVGTLWTLMLKHYQAYLKRLDELGL